MTKSKQVSKGRLSGRKKTGGWPMKIIHPTTGAECWPAFVEDRRKRAAARAAKRAAKHSDEPKTYYCLKLDFGFTGRARSWSRVETGRFFTKKAAEQADQILRDWYQNRSDDRGGSNLVCSPSQEGGSRGGSAGGS